MRAHFSRGSQTHVLTSRARAQGNILMQDTPTHTHTHARRTPHIFKTSALVATCILRCCWCFSPPRCGLSSSCCHKVWCDQAIPRERYSRVENVQRSHTNTASYKTNNTNNNNTTTTTTTVVYIIYSIWLHTEGAKRALFVVISILLVLYMSADRNKSRALRVKCVFCLVCVYVWVCVQSKMIDVLW